MTAAERIVWERIRRRVASMTPEMAAAILRAFANVRAAMSEADIVRAVQQGGADRLINEVLTATVLKAAYEPVRDRLRENVVAGVRAYGRAIPNVRTVTIAFDYLNPRVIDAIRELETGVVQALDQSIKEAARAVITGGLREGAAARTVARDLRGMVGLGPTQVQEVQNLRDALSGLNGRSITDYSLRNRTVDRLLAKGPLSPAQIDKYVEEYRKARIANNAHTIAQTAARDTQKLAQRLSWSDAIEKGAVDGGRLVHEWVGVNDDRERPEHVAMNGEVQPWDQPYSNGQMVPGESDYNCRCVDRFYLARS